MARAQPCTGRTQRTAGGLGLLQNQLASAWLAQVGSHPDSLRPLSTVTAPSHVPSIPVICTYKAQVGREAQVQGNCGVPQPLVLTLAPPACGSPLPPAVLCPLLCPLLPLKQHHPPLSAVGVPVLRLTPSRFPQVWPRTASSPSSPCTRILHPRGLPPEGRRLHRQKVTGFSEVNIIPTAPSTTPPS